MKKYKMASLTGETQEFDEEQYKQHMEALESVKTEQELDSKLSKIGFSIGSWMKYVFNRDSSSGTHDAVWLTDDEYRALAEKSLTNAWRIINLTSWHLEKKGIMKGDTVESIHTDDFGKIYRCTGIIDCPPWFLYREYRDNLVNLSKWNPTILKTDMIKDFGDGVDLSYQVTAGGGRGIVAPRDFVILRRTTALSSEGKSVKDEDNAFGYITSGISVTVPGYPPTKEYVRGDSKVGCWYLKPTEMKTSSGIVDQKTLFQWLMCCDMKGKIPQFVLDTAFATVMLDYLVHVRKFAADAKAKGLFNEK